MKKYSILFVLFSVAAIIFLWFNSSSNKHFLFIKDNKFILNEQAFYPVTLNYIVSLQTDGNSLWPSSSNHYGPNAKFLYTTRDSCLLQLKAEMELIKELGFNSVRIVGIGEEQIDDESHEISVNIRLGNTRDSSIILTQGENYQNYFMALQELFNVVGEAGLKIIFLTRVLPDVANTEDHLGRLAFNFRNDTHLIAYDLFNEPLYFDKPERNKEDVYTICKKWNKIVKQQDPNHLITIGLTGIRETFEWDPNMLDVDFISIHPYEYEPEQVRNEMYWYGKYIKKPWIIGETSIPADNDSVTYEEQREFARNTMDQTYNCGGMGYSWWQYKDVDWHVFHASYMGVLNNEGETRIKKNIAIKGTPKPVAKEFKIIVSKKDTCKCFDNYYNYSKNNKFKITGLLQDENDDPIEGGVILAWNEWWTHSYHTVTKEDGSFELYSNYPFYHWMASATNYSMVRGDISPDTASVSAEGTPTINIGRLKVKELSYSYIWLKRVKSDLFQ